MTRSAGSAGPKGAMEAARDVSANYLVPIAASTERRSVLWTYGPPACLVLLIGGAALNGSALQLEHLSIYPEYVALGAVLVWAAAASASRQIGWYVPGALLPLGLWLGAELLATLLHAPDKHHSLELWLKLPLMVTTYVLVANLARDRVAVAVTAQLAVAAAVGVVAVSAYASWRLTGSHLGMRYPGRNLGHSWLPAATLREPDILGSYLAAAVLLAVPVAALLRRGRSLLRDVAWTAVGLAAAGTALSGSRTAWLVVLAGLCIPAGLEVARRPGAVARKAAVPLVLVAACALGLVVLHLNPLPAFPVFNPQETGDLAQRVASFGHLSQDRNITVRLDVARNALDHWRAHPLTGWGVGAYGEVYTYPPPDTIHAGWIANLPVHLLYDSGLLGLAAFCWAVGLVGLRGIQAWRRSSGLAQTILAGLLLALFGLLLAFQATEATWFAYPWIYLGLLEAGTLSTSVRRPPALEVVP